MKWSIEKIVFGVIVLFLVYKFVLPRLERFENPSSKTDHPCPPNSIKCPSGDCRIKTDIYGLCE